MPGQTSSGNWVARVQDLGVSYHLGTFDSHAEAEREEWYFKIDNGIPIHTGRAAAEARRILSGPSYQQMRIDLLNKAYSFRDKTYMPFERDLPGSKPKKRK